MTLSFAFSSSSHFKANLVWISYLSHSLIDSNHSYHSEITVYSCRWWSTPCTDKKQPLKTFLQCQNCNRKHPYFFGFAFETLFHPSQSSCTFGSYPSFLKIMSKWTCHTSTLKKVVADPCLGPKCTIAAWHSSVPWCRAIELLLHIVSSTLLCRSWI